MFSKSQIVESAATGVPTSAFRGCSAYVREPKPGDEGFFLIRVASQENPEVSVHFFRGSDEMNVALAIDRLRTRKQHPSFDGPP